MIFERTPTRLFITGIAGFIGSSIADTIIKSISYDDFAISGIDKNDNTFIKGDLFYINDFHNALEHNDIIIHCASNVGVENIVETPNIPLTSTFEVDKRVVDFCALNEKKLVYFSTSEVYGSGSILAENAHLKINSELRSNYALEKLFMERYIRAHMKPEDYLIIRPFNVTGVGQSSKGVIPKFVDLIISNMFNPKNIKLPVRVNPIGKEPFSSRCYCDARDFCCLLLRLIQKWDTLDDENRIYNIGNPYNEINSKDLALKILKYASNFIKLDENLENHIEYVEPIALSHNDYEIEERVPCIDKIKFALDLPEEYEFKDLTQIVEEIFKYRILR